MSSEDRLARLGLAHLANDPPALQRALEELVAKNRALENAWLARKTELDAELLVRQRAEREAELDRAALPPRERLPTDAPVKPAAVAPTTSLTLDALLYRSRLDLRAAGQLARDTLSILLPLHDAGAAHGALAPHRIVRSERGRFQLLFTGEQLVSASGHLAENPLYASPEALSGPVAPAGDVYTVGCIVYVALSGQFPFEGGTILEVSRAKALGAFRPLPDASPELHAWLSWVLAVKPYARASTRQALDFSWDKTRSRPETA